MTCRKQTITCSTTFRHSQLNLTAFQIFWYKSASLEANEMMLDYFQWFVLFTSICTTTWKFVDETFGELHSCTRCSALLKVRIFILKRYFNTFAQIQGLASPIFSSFIPLLFFFTEDSFMSKYKKKIIRNKYNLLHTKCIYSMNNLIALIKIISAYSITSIIDIKRWLALLHVDSEHWLW